MQFTAIETDAARILSPRVAWPTLVLALVLAGAHIALFRLGMGGAVSPWWLTVPLGVSAYLHYTPAHEAIHRNIVRSRRFDPLNRLIGSWAGLWLGMSWPQLLHTHVAHHTHTNGEHDPDRFVQGSLARLCALAAISVVTNLVPVPVWALIYGRNAPSLGYLDAWKIMSKPDWRRHQIVHGAMCAAVWAAVAFGHAEAAFALYVIPATIGRLLMGIFLSWLPHRPFVADDRYRSATLRPGGLAAIASVGHSMHLIHHLWPRVPFYRYHALYRQVAPLLHDRGAVVRR